MAGSFAACVGAPAKKNYEDVEETPAQWTQEFNMPGLLDQPPAVRSQTDLRRLLELPWYTGIVAESSTTGDIETVANCNDYFSVGAANARAQRLREQNALLELEVMCEATRLLSAASTAQQSNIPERFLDEHLPGKLTKFFALVISHSEWQRIRNDGSKTRWSDVNTLNEVRQTSPNTAEYRSDAGLQIFSILGRGDFNGDRREDLIVTVKDTVGGGSYFNLRLFVLTVTDQGDWQVATGD